MVTVFDAECCSVESPSDPQRGGRASAHFSVLDVNAWLTATIAAAQVSLQKEKDESQELPRRRQQALN
jgi:hypothetical protein